MAIVFIPALLRPLAGGQARVVVPGATVLEVIDSLERHFPGLKEKLVDGNRLRPNVSVAVDGEITPLGLLETAGPLSEVHFVTAIKGGRFLVSRQERTCACENRGRMAAIRHDQGSGVVRRRM